MSYATAIRELGYPSKGALINWHKEYIKNGDLHKGYLKKSKCSEEERQKAVSYYLEDGKYVSRTVRILGYPSRPELDAWIKELATEGKKYCRSGRSLIKYTREQKKKRHFLVLKKQNGSVFLDRPAKMPAFQALEI
jgi:putative transposase